jgi:hypothetical protein
MPTNEEKLAALDLLASQRERDKKFIWVVERDGVEIELEDVVLKDGEAAQTFYTVFNPDISAEARDAFIGNCTEMQDREDMVFVDGQVKYTTWSLTPTRALKSLAAADGFSEGLWPMRGTDGTIQARRLTPKNKGSVSKLISQLDILAIHMLLTQAMEFHLEHLNTDTNEVEPSPIAAAVDDAGNLPTSVD